MPVKVLLQEVRKSKGLSQNDLARSTNMSLQNIQKIEQGGAKSLTFKTLTKFCQILECQPGDLLVYEEGEGVKIASQQKVDKKKENEQSEQSVKKHGYLSLEVNQFAPSIMARVT